MKKLFFWFSIATVVLITVVFYFFTRFNNFVFLRADDPEFLEAVQVAQESFPTFEKSFLEYGKTEVLQEEFNYYVKASFTEGEQVEHMWIAVTNINNQIITGLVNNEPQIVTNVLLGDVVTISTDDVEDWGYIDPEGNTHGFFLYGL